MSTPIDSPVYTLGAWSGNVRDDWGVDWVVTGEDGWSSSPPVRPVGEDKQTGDGSWQGPGYWSARVVTLTGKALAPSRASMLQAKERLKGALNPRGVFTLEVEEEHLQRYARVRLTDQADITDYGSRAFDWSFSLTAPDPAKYGAASVGETGLSASSLTSRTYPRTYPLSYGAGSVEGGGAVEWFNAGNYDQTGGIVEFRGPVSDPQVTHAQTGRSLGFSLTLAEGEVLVIDLTARTAMLGGTSPRLSTLTGGSAWFWLPPGWNQLWFRGQAGPSSSGTTPLMTVTASSAWV